MTKDKRRWKGKKSYSEKKRHGRGETREDKEEVGVKQENVK